MTAQLEQQNTVVVRPQERHADARAKLLEAKRRKIYIARARSASSVSKT